MSYAASRPRERGGAAFGAAALTLALGYALLAGLQLNAEQKAQEALEVFDVIPPEPPPPERAVPAKRVNDEPEGEAAPPNLRAEPSEVVAPPPVIEPPEPPPPVVAAPVAGVGAAPSAGAADIPGPGTGAGGVGNGRGAGGSGDGRGGGYDETPPRLIRGRLRNSDYPRAAGEAGAGGLVSVRYLVWTDGRVVDCEVTRSSGSRVLDDTTCRLIMERFRFRPSRDSRGRPVPATIVENHEWLIRQAPPEDGGRR